MEDPPPELSLKSLSVLFHGRLADRAAATPALSTLLVLPTLEPRLGDLLPLDTDPLSRQRRSRPLRVFDVARPLRELEGEEGLLSGVTTLTGTVGGEEATLVVARVMEDLSTSS